MDLGDLDTAATLDVAAGALRAGRAAGAEVLKVAVHWADLHPGAGKIRDEHGWVEHPVQLGGEGTPEVMEFCPAELAVMLEIHPLGCRSLIADALDLRHRTPHLWQLTVDDLRVPDWVARKIARMTRHLTKATAAVIDARIAGDTDDAATLSPSRLFDLVEGMVVAADNASADDDRADGLSKRFVNISDHKSDPGTTGVYGCIDEAGGKVLEETITRLAQALADAGDTDPVDLRRAKALVLLATPALALQWQLGLVPSTPTDNPTDTPTDTGPSESEPGQPDGDLAALAAVLATIDPAKLAPTAILYLHLTDQTLFTMNDGVARFEGVGPITRDHLIDLLGHTNVVVKPLHLPAEHRAADSYEYTGNLREAVLLLHPRDVYPYAVGATRSFDIDLDHTQAYDDTGPPGQTSIDNAGPMHRHHHRIKTHGPMSVKQPKLGTYVWRTPHRHYRMTDNTGTHQVRREDGDAIYGTSTMEVALATCLITYRG